MDLRSLDNFDLGRLRRKRNFRTWRLGDFMNSGGTQFESTAKYLTNLFMACVPKEDHHSTCGDPTCFENAAGSQISCTFGRRCWRQWRKNGSVRIGRRIDCVEGNHSAVVDWTEPVADPEQT